MKLSTIINPEKIDLISRTKDGSFKLIIAEKETWDGNPVQMDALTKKLKYYLLFVQGKHIIKMYPEAKDKKVIIQLDYYSGPLPETIQKLIQNFSAVYIEPLLTFTTLDIS